MDRTIEELDPLLRAAVEAGVMTLEHAWYVDDLGSELADAVCAGDLTQETAGAIGAIRGVRDALHGRGKA